jgi:tetratricopeptide (TPR) repeat protein
VDNLAFLLERKGDYAGAQPLYERALEARERVLGPEHPSTLGSVNNLAFLLERKGDYAGAQPLYERALKGLLKISAATRRPHPNLQTFVANYAGCLQKMGRGDAEIRDALNALMRPFGMSVGGDTAGAAGSSNDPSPKLRAVLEEIMRDPSKLQEIAARLQRDDPALFQELLAFIESQQG